MVRTTPTPRQREVIRFVQSYLKRNGIPPTRQEVADSMGCARNAIQQHLMLLERKGFVRLLPMKARGIVLL